MTRFVVRPLSALALPDDLTLRIVVRDPHPEVPLRMQRGRYERVAPLRTSPDAVTFELCAQVVTRADGTIVLRGPEVQGPPAQRFVYVNAGSGLARRDPWPRRSIK